MDVMINPFNKYDIQICHNTKMKFSHGIYLRLLCMSNSTDQRYLIGDETSKACVEVREALKRSSLNNNDFKVSYIYGHVNVRFRTFDDFMYFMVKFIYTEDYN